MEELGQRLGLKEATAYELVAKGHFEVVDVLGKRRVTKESFERWYQNQTRYQLAEDRYVAELLTRDAFAKSAYMLDAEDARSTAAGSLGLRRCFSVKIIF